MKVLVVGSGGREHAICWRLRQSKSVSALFCAPGNPGTAKIAENVPLAVDRIEEIARFVQSNSLDLTIVGPEVPLTLGIVDHFRQLGLRIFGPTKAAALLEGSKSFAKEVMVAAGVPTASYASFTAENELRSWLSSHPGPIVLKADGLAAGKGVYVCKTAAELEEGIQGIFQGLKAHKVIAEQFLEGKEASFIVATNGRDILPLAAAHDYKRIGDGDKGLNTGGMGSVCPTPNLSEAQAKWVIENVMRPVISEMDRRGTPFSGFLYAGLMISPKGEISVLEFNARLGDPETQSILRCLDDDFAQAISALVDGKPAQLSWRKGASVCIVLAADGYPGEIRKGDEISGIEFAETMPESVIFHAGTSFSNNSKLVTSGGRVLSVTAFGKDIAEARSRAYRAADMIQFRGRQMRRDIAG